MGPDDPLTAWEITLRLLLAATCGAALGWEREAKQKPAGLRTHMLVTVGAAIFMVLTMKLFHSGSNGMNYEASDTEGPLRVVAGIVGGVGFLGAGAIIEARGAVRGITTAAGIWVAAAIGVGCGMGYYEIALISIACALIIMVGVKLLERLVFSHHPREDEA